MIEFNQLTEIRDYVTNRFEALYNQLYEVDSRFIFLPKSGYIRFSNIIDGTFVGSGAVVSWTAKWVQAYTQPKFSFCDGSIISFDEFASSKNNFSWLNDDAFVVGWKHQLDFFCDKIYSDLMAALKQEAEMKHKIKIWEIRRAANVFC